MTFRHARGTHKRLDSNGNQVDSLVEIIARSHARREKSERRYRGRLVERSLATSRICAGEEVWHNTTTINVQRRRVRKRQRTVRGKHSERIKTNSTLPVRYFIERCCCSPRGGEHRENGVPVIFTLLYLLRENFPFDQRKKEMERDDRNRWNSVL